MFARAIGAICALAVATAACTSVTGLDELSFAASSSASSSHASSSQTTTAGGAAPGGAGGASTTGGAPQGGTAGYVAEVLADQPLAYWRLGEPSGTDALDMMGTYPGTYAGSVQLGQPGAIAGDADGSVAFLGTGSVVMGDVLDFPGASSFTVEAWVAPALTQTDYQGICGKRTGSSNTQGYILRISATGRPNFTVFSNNITAEAELAVPLLAGVYAHMVGTFDGIMLRLYVNGTEVASALSPGEVQDTNAAFSIAADPGNTAFEGFIDEVAIYGTALSQARIAAHHAAGTMP